ncbi:Uncharacterised protein [Escherichia coli]|nr:Uncharacterised protein [Escherichia coli]
MRKVCADHGLIEEIRLFLDHKVVEHIAFKSRGMNKDVRQLPHRNA